MFLYSPDEMIVKLQDTNFRFTLIDWVNRTLRPMENDALYLMVARDPNYTPLDTARLETILGRLNAYIVRGTPAHELGHHIFDVLGALALISDDPFISRAYRNEIDAAFLAASFHDVCTGVQHRYIDNLWELDHGEIAAWIVYHALEGLVSEPVRRLTAYAIAAHPHKSSKAADGSPIYRWRDLLFFDGEYPVRLAVWVTRWTDRLENGADGACHAPRHALANVDGARVNAKRADGTTVSAMDLHGTDWYTFLNALVLMFKPQLGVVEMPVTKNGEPVLKDGEPVLEKVPTLLQHLRGYANSAVAYPYSAYNQLDDRSPNMRGLMDKKVAFSAAFIDAVLNSTGAPDFELFVKLMKKKSGYPNNQMTIDTIEMVRDLWNQTPAADQAHWAHGFEVALQQYDQWLAILQDRIAQATDPTVIAFRPLVPGLVTLVTKE